MICQETVDTLLTFRGTQLLTYYSTQTSFPNSYLGHIRFYYYCFNLLINKIIKY